MPTISAAEFQKHFGKYRDLAQREPVAVTSYGRESVVLISAAEYERFRSLDSRRPEYVWEMRPADADALAETEPPADAEAYNDEDSSA